MRTQIGSGAVWEPVVGYSRAVRVGSTVYVAGTTAATPDGGAIGPGDPAEQTREALRRIATALRELGADLTDVVRTRIFVPTSPPGRRSGAPTARCSRTSGR